MLLDINFNFGTFESSEPSYFLTILLPILITVTLTVMFQRFYDNFKKNEDLDSIYKHTKKQALKLGNAAVEQAQSLRKFSCQIAAKEVKDFNFKPIPEFNTDLIKDWDSLEFYLAVVCRKDSKIETLIDYHQKIKATLNAAREDIRHI